MRGLAGAAVVAAACTLATGARADVWDEGPANDNTLKSSVNELIHGVAQVHDLAGQAGSTVEDVDWYRVQVPFHTSFEVIVDDLAGGIGGPGAAPIMELIDTDGSSSAIQFARPVTRFGSARRVTGSYAKPGSTGEKALFVRVRGAACGAACTPASRYRIRFYETTLRLPRFNTAQGQSTVLILQNPTNLQENIEGYAFGATGQPLGGLVTFLAPNAVQAIDLSSAGLANKAGGLQLLNIAPYGSLTGKAVQFDPATGFVFETPLSYRPY